MPAALSKAYEFYPAVFRSAARLTYTQVWGWLSGEVQPETEVHQRLQPQLQALNALFQILLRPVTSTARSTSRRSRR